MIAVTASMCSSPPHMEPLDFKSMDDVKGFEDFKSVDDVKGFEDSDCLNDPCCIQDTTDAVVEPEHNNWWFSSPHPNDLDFSLNEDAEIYESI